MKFIKNNKLTVFIIGVFIVCVVITAYAYNLFFGGSNRAVYGNRLDGIKTVKVSKKQFNEIEEKMGAKDGVTKVSASLSGKVVNIIVTVKEDIDKDTAKNIGNSSLELIDKEQLEFYDVQVFVKKDNEALNDFPIIGYKKSSKEGIVWAKDRAVTSNEE